MVEIQFGLVFNQSSVKSCEFW